MEPNLAASGTTPPVAGAAEVLPSGGTPSPMIGAVTYPDIDLQSEKIYSITQFIITPFTCTWRSDYQSLRSVHL